MAGWTVDVDLPEEDPGDDADAEWARAAEAAEAAATADLPRGPAAPTRARPAHAPPRKPLKTKRRADKKTLVLGTVTAVTVSVLTVTTLTALRDGEAAARPASGPSPTPKTTVTFGRKAPPGWSSQVAWSAPIRPGTHPAMAAGGLVALITTDRRLQLRHGSTGAVVWTTPGPLAAEASSRPVATVADGRPWVAVQAGNRLTMWPVYGDGTAPTDIVLPDKAQVSHAGTAPLISLPGGRAGLVQGGRVVAVDLPEKAVAMAAEGTTVIAGTPRGTWWRLTPGGKPKKVTARAPQGARQVSRLAAAGQGTVTLVWSGGKSRDLTAAVHDAVTGAVRASAPASPRQLRAPVWVRGTDGVTAALGPVVFHLKNATATTYPGFSPLAAIGPTAYGRIGHRMVTVPAGRGAPVNVPAATALPWGATAGGRVIVADRTSDGIALFALTATR